MKEVEAVLAGERRWAVVHGDCTEVLSSVGAVDHLITDPPYSRTVHENVRSGRRNGLPDVEDFACRTKRQVDLGFEYLKPSQRRFIAQWCGKNVKRWSLAFSDVESSTWWRISFQAAGLVYRRTCTWRRLGSAPQFNGLCPAEGVEKITCAHAPGRFRWNGGGKAGVYDVPIVANRLGQRGSRVHSTQKPADLMLSLVQDFTDPDEVVLDAFCGSATTGEACLRLGRRFIGIEKDAKYHALSVERLTAEEQGSTLQARRAGQTTLFGK